MTVASATVASRADRGRLADRKAGRGVQEVGPRRRSRISISHFGENSGLRHCWRAVSTSPASPLRTTATSTPRSRSSKRGRHVIIEKPSVLALAGTRRTRGPRQTEERAGQGRLPQARSTPTTKSSGRSSPTASCSTSTTATARCWSRSRSPGLSSRSGSPAATRGRTSPVTTSS